MSFFMIHITNRQKNQSSSVRHQKTKYDDNKRMNACNVGLFYLGVFVIGRASRLIL